MQQFDLSSSLVALVLDDRTAETSFGDVLRCTQVIRYAATHNVGP